MSKEPRRPTVFDLDDLNVVEGDYVPGVGAPPVLTPEVDPFQETEEDADRQPLPKRGFRWAQMFWTAAGALATLAIGLAVDSLIRDMFARSEALGWLGFALAAIGIIAVVGITVREVRGILRIRKVTEVHDQARAVLESDDREAARALVTEVSEFYARRPETARGRAALAGHAREIIDGRDLVGLAERELVLPLDDTARRLVMNAAKRVAVVTAISPRAVVDLLFVVIQILRLIRELAALYDGRPGTLGFWRLTRSVAAHLAVTGGMAAGDSLVQQLLGHGIAARLSARLGEGIVNGLLTARVGIAAIEVCRPLPFINGRPPRLADVMAELRKVNSDEGDDSQAPK
ncbi:YcjF family protein [Bauldia sp.]|uniref:YcjF family protein n=1 Tax=Bauldia sp. TaxID=2575872 RepID=UPI003BAB0959